jgi:GT2 family glycosyltransferase
MDKLKRETRSQTIPVPSQLTISVIVPVYNGGDKFRRCLSSLTEATPSFEELIVIANGDTDGSRRIAEESNAIVLKFPAPMGPARARNLGARSAHGDILIFVDADVAVSPDTMARVKSAFSNDPELAALFGSYDDEPSASNFLSQYKNLLHHYVHQTAKEDASTFWGACGAIRRSVFVAMGGFDEIYDRPSIEDIELGYRLTQAGHKVRLCKDLKVKHLKRWTLTSLLHSDFYDRALPWTELILREKRFINDLNLRRSSRISVMLTYGLLAALIGSYWWSGSFAIALGLAFSLLGINAPLYRFFSSKRGPYFALKTIPCHWCYYFYSGAAFMFVLGRQLLRKKSFPGSSGGNRLILE